MGGQQLFKARVTHDRALRRSNHHLLGNRRLGKLRGCGRRQQAGGIPCDSRHGRKRSQASHQLPPEITVVGCLATATGHIGSRRMSDLGRRAGKIALGIRTRISQGLRGKTLVQARKKCRVCAQAT